MHFYEVWGKVIFFTPVFTHSVHRGGTCVAGAGRHACMVHGACVAGGMCVWCRGMCMAGGMHGRYYEIWSMSGQYASYWNAFLLNFSSEG